MSHKVIQAFDQGHKSGFIHGYQMAVQDIRTMLCGVRDRIDADDVAAIEARYHEIYGGIENSAQVIKALEAIQEALA